MNHVHEEVRAFYSDMPFNWYGDEKCAVENLQSDPIGAYPDLAALLEECPANVLELGCGAGWAANGMALHYGASVTAVDFCEAAIDRAGQVAQSVGVADRTTFICQDLLSYQPDTPPDVVVSIGVLHHTADCRAAFAHAASCVPRGGALFVGLYHKYGRKPFLDHFKGIAKAQGEDAALHAFARIAPLQAADTTHLKSWFRDQVLHPFETQHSIEEIAGWLDDAGLVLETTNLNGYQDPADRSLLYAKERTMEELSVTRNIKQGQYFPGFFTILAHRL